MVSAGKIRRLARGLYDYPMTGPDQRALPPSPDAVARALAGRHNIRLIPAGAYAAHLLGLSALAPGQFTFLTDGLSRNFCVAGQEIRLKRTTPRNMGAAGRMSGLVIQALRHLGQEDVREAVIRKVKKRLSSEEKKQLLEDLPLAPEWVKKHLRSIAREVA